MIKKTFRHLGRTTKRAGNKPNTSLLETFPNQHQTDLYLINLTCLEFTTLCPITGQPDFARLHLKYIPDQLCVESKSLKLYLGSFRNHGNFHEDVTNVIAKTLFSLLKPKYLHILGDFNARGGIAIKPFVIKQTKLAPDEQEKIEQLLRHNSHIKSSF